MHINRLVERFLREQGLSPTRFGRLAAGDPRLVLDMRMGREIRPAMERKLRHFIATRANEIGVRRSEAA